MGGSSISSPGESVGPAVGEAAAQELLVGAGGGQAQGFPPGMCGGGVLAEAEMKLADDGVPAGVAGEDVFRGNGSQTVEGGLRAMQVGLGDGAIQGVQR